MFSRMFSNFSNKQRKLAEFDESAKLNTGRDSEVKESVYNIYELNESTEKRQTRRPVLAKLESPEDQPSQPKLGESSVIRILVNSKCEDWPEKPKPKNVVKRSNSEFLTLKHSKPSFSTSSKFSKIRSIVQLNERKKSNQNLLNISNSINSNALNRSSFRKLNKKNFRNTILNRVKDFQKNRNGSSQMSFLQTKIKRQQTRQKFVDQLIREKQAMDSEKEVLGKKMTVLSSLFDNLIAQI